MKKIFFLMLTLLMLSVASMNAQVLIGGDGTDNPDPSAVLELKSGNLGLLLPRVALQSTTDKTTIPNPAAGLTVYNTVTTGSGATAVAPGIYVFTGTAWALQAPPVIITQPESFSWSRLYEKDGDPNGPASATVEDLTVEASGAGLTYQWYKKAVNKNAADTLLISETSNTYTPVVTAWGMNSYYCVVSNAYGNVISNVADVAVGCGAKTSDDTWLKFMCHNLGALPVGADQSLDDITFGSGTTVTDTLSFDAKGWLFQWGRAADGHQWRSSATVPGPVTLPADDTPIPSSDKAAYGKFITSNTTPFDWREPQRDYLWRNWTEGRFPCPPGWRIPSSSEWGSIYRTGGSYGAPGKGTANTWNWTATGKGFLIKPDDRTTTLYLPAAGCRQEPGTLHGIASYGDYWSAESAATGARYIHAHRTGVSPWLDAPRIFGFSVRCLMIE